MSNGSGKEVIKISPEVEGMQLGHPNFIGCYKKVVAKIGTEAALRLYDGMSEGKSAFICASDPRLDSFSVRWTLPRLKEIVEAGYLTRNQVLHRDMERNARYDDYYYDEWDRAEFYGPKDTVTYARWLYNRYGAGKVAKQFHVSPDFAEALGNSDLPGGIKVASLEGKVENIDAIEERIEDRHAAAFMNAEQLADFRKNGSRKLKVRMNRLMDHPEIYVLKKLLEAEEFSIAAKECIYKYRDYNYGKKSERLKEAIEKLPDTTKERLQTIIGSMVVPGTTVNTDDSKSYNGLNIKGYTHNVVNHSAKQYVDGMAYTNSIESVWSVLKRGFYGTFHKFSIKHLQRYVDEFDFRLNDGNVKIPTDERINSVICGCWGKIMPYKTLKII